MPGFEDRFYAALREAGMPDVPEGFSVALVSQVVPRTLVAAIESFIRVFDRVTTRPTWQEAMTARGPAIVRQRRSEICFFSAWDFHLPPERPDRFQLIECNDNGSGMMFAAILNRLYYELSGVGERRAIEAPPSVPAFGERVLGMIRTEARAFSEGPSGLVLILDDAQSLRAGKFRHEHVLLRDLCRRAGWRAQTGSPAETTWEGGQLLCRGERVAFVVNRSTDFFWDGEAFSALRAAYAEGSVLVVPNPFTYATRSDKRLLEPLSRPVSDVELGIRPDERVLLSVHVPETRLLRPENVDELAREKEQWFFKPCHGFASHGLLTGAQVGRTRLRQLLKKGNPYVAQRRAPKSHVDAGEGVSLWTDLRVWAYRGERVLLSGRASRHPDSVDFSSPGGWIPTYVERSGVDATQGELPSSVVPCSAG
ncbi:MAG TPA: hypothetical protein VL742_09065 [Casimicrobiaceae bacterium]|nr:hypothetical protein [Casimicrobiaceae bacterium]